MSHPPAPNKRNSLLLVVDDWEALEVYENSLGPYFEIHGAPFGSEGVRMAQEQRPDRILLDLTLEDMSAEEACRAFRSTQETRSIPITVVLDASEGDEEPFQMKGIFPLPGDQVIRRPYEILRLIELLKPLNAKDATPSPRDPLHGMTLEMILTQLLKHFGWAKLGKMIDINCFNKDPSIKSSLKFLRRTPWARKKVEELFLDFQHEQAGK